MGKLTNCLAPFFGKPNFDQKKGSESLPQQSIKNWMGPYQRTPKKVTRAIKYPGLGVRSVGPVGDFLETTLPLRSGFAWPGPSSVSSMPSASMKAGRSGYHSPQERWKIVDCFVVWPRFSEVEGHVHVRLFEATFLVKRSEKKGVYSGFYYHSKGKSTIWRCISYIQLGIFQPSLC